MGAPFDLANSLNPARYRDNALYFIVNHSVPSGQIRDVFRQVAGVEFAPDSPLEGSGFEFPVPREIALRSRSGLALQLRRLALRRRGPDWNGRPTAKAFGHWLTSFLTLAP